MRKRIILLAISALTISIFFGCSEHSISDLFLGSSTDTDQSASSSDVATIQYWTAVDWDGTSAPEPNKFYRITDIQAAKQYFSEDQDLMKWLNSLPQLDEIYKNRVPSAENNQVLKVTLTDKPLIIAQGPELAALTWSASATITPESGGSIGWCRTVTTNPSGVTGLKSHQIWLFNQNGYVYYVNGWETTDLLEHSVGFEIGRNVACDSTLWCMGRVVCNGVKALDTDSYTRSCD